jgi:hypothetical protein
MSPVLMELDGQARVANGHSRDSIKYLSRQERIIKGAQKESRALDAVQKRQGTGFSIVIAGVGESVKPCSDGLIEFSKGARAAQLIFVEQSGLLCQLCQRLLA